MSADNFIQVKIDSDATIQSLPGNQIIAGRMYLATDPLDKKLYVGADDETLIDITPSASNYQFTIEGTSGSEVVENSDIVSFVGDGTVIDFVASAGVGGVEVQLTFNISALMGNEVMIYDSNTASIQWFVLSHDSLPGYVENDHIDHSTIFINTAVNSGLAGGGNIAANRSLILDVDNLPVVASLDVNNDYLPVFSAGGGVTGKVLVNAVSAGGTIPATTQEVEVVGSDTLVLPAGTLIQSIVVIGADGAVNIGTTNGGGQLVDDEIQGKPLIYSTLYDPYFPSGITIYFQGTYTAKLMLWAIG